MAGAFVGLNIDIVEKGLAILDPGECIIDICFPGPDRFDLASLHLDARFAAFENVKIPQRFAIENRLGGHGRATPKLRLGAVGG